MKINMACLSPGLYAPATSGDAIASAKNILTLYIQGSISAGLPACGRELRSDRPAQDRHSHLVGKLLRFAGSRTVARDDLDCFDLQVPVQLVISSGHAGKDLIAMSSKVESRGRSFAFAFA